MLACHDEGEYGHVTYDHMGPAPPFPFSLPLRSRTVTTHGGLETWGFIGTVNPFCDFIESGFMILILLKILEYDRPGIPVADDMIFVGRRINTLGVSNGLSLFPWLISSSRISTTVGIIPSLMRDQKREIDSETVHEEGH